MALVWTRPGTPAELHDLLTALADEYPLSGDGPGTPIRFEPDERPGALAVGRTDKGFLVRYGSRAAAARGVAYALAGTQARETLPFATFGVMLDCSRNGVMTVAHFKRWLRRLSLMGYTMAMLYTKDTYRVEGEPFFGYMRGAYSREEIREIDAYAARLGIEIVACIQALGHLEPILRWPAYAGVADTANVLLVDEEKTYALLDKMIRFWSEALSARRIHLGMDETHDLGRGRFMDLHGYERPFDIYNRHLRRVCALCEGYGLAPMIWSDMYFRFGNKNLDYYDPETVVPDDVKAAIDPRVTLVYWDYYHRDEAFYANHIERHRAIGRGDPVMASGIWTWSRMWYDHVQTVATVKPCLDACRKTGLKEIVFTMWGDDGAYCEFDSAFAGMAWAADYAFNGAADDERIGKLFAAVCGTSLQTQLAACGVEFHFTAKDGRAELIPAAAALWDDPLMGIVRSHFLGRDPDAWTKAAAALTATAAAIAPHRADAKAGRIEHAWRVCDALIKKISFADDLAAAYRAGDRAALADLRDRRVPEVVAAIEALNESFRGQWLRSFKPYGLEVMQIKLAGLRERYRETGRRIGEYLDGARQGIEELEAETQTSGRLDTRYRMIATGGWFI